MRLSCMKYLVAIIVFATTSFAQTAKLKIIHFNDTHAQNTPITIKRGDSTIRIGGFPHFKTVIDSLRGVASANGEGVLVLGAGDDFQGTLFSTMTRGASQIVLLNQLAPDAVTLGNHEFDYGWENIDSLVKYQVKYPIVSSNLYYKNGTRMVKPYLIKEVNGVRVAIIGMMTDGLAGVTLPRNIEGITIEKEADALRKILPKVKSEKPDIIIVLSHIGIEADIQLAESFPDVDLFVGGHSHTAIFNPRKKGRSIVVQADCKTRHVGELDITVNTEKDRIAEYKGKLIEVRSDERRADPVALSMIDSMSIPIEKMFGDTIGTLVKDWKKTGFNSNITTWHAKVLREMVNTDIGIMNTGGIRKNLSSGHITIRDMYEINPFNNQIIVYQATGKELHDMLEFYFSDKGSERCEFNGLSCTVDKTKKDGQRVSTIKIGSDDIQMKHIYSISANSFVSEQMEPIFGVKLANPFFLETGITDISAYINAVKAEKQVSGRTYDWVEIKE
jgi:5'-nucleotidase/UDP-sugar diphosphatase